MKTGSVGFTGEYSGFLIMLDERRRGWRVDSLLNEQQVTKFTDTFSTSDWQLKDVEVCLLCVGADSLTHLSLARRGRKVATGKCVVEFFDIEPIDPPIPLDSLEQLLPGHLRQYFVRTSTGQGGRLPKATWEQLIKAIGQSSPETVERIQALDARRRSLQTKFSGGSMPIITEERDACFLALDLFGFSDDKDSLATDWMQKRQPTELPFLEGLGSTRLLEDTMIQHDAAVFGDWQQIKRNQVGAVEFHDYNSDRSMLILNVNRTPIENVLGVDLLYYNPAYRAYVLVQYKRMMKEDSIGGRWLYRPIDKSYQAELERMRKFESRLVKTPTLLDDYRLNFGPFYFKLCNAETYTPSDSGLIKGMYLPLEYWERLLADDKTKGSHGGRGVGYHNSGRHLNNTNFITLVKDGWIGSAADDTDCITDIIRELLERNHSVFLATGSSTSTGNIDLDDILNRESDEF